LEELRSVAELAASIEIIRDMNPQRVSTLSLEQREAAVTIAKHPELQNVLQKLKYLIGDSAE
jgi:hypothetical protein